MRLFRIKKSPESLEMAHSEVGIRFATQFRQFRPLTQLTASLFTMTQKILALHFFAMGICLVLFFQNSLPPDSKPVPPTADNYFRQTRFGWQDSRQWVSLDPQFEETRIHPGWIALLLAIGIVGVVVWSTEEDEIANLLGLRVQAKSTESGTDPTAAVQELDLEKK
jgi:hypothetical protein